MSRSRATRKAKMCRPARRSSSHIDTIVIITLTTPTPAVAKIAPDADEMPLIAGWLERSK
jgi:hypothetical protein